jgi:hypothetical protein
MAFTLKVTGAAHYAVVNPDTIAAQAQGRALFGLTAIRTARLRSKGDAWSEAVSTITGACE